MKPALLATQRNETLKLEHRQTVGTGEAGDDVFARVWRSLRAGGRLGRRLSAHAESRLARSRDPARL